MKSVHLKTLAFNRRTLALAAGLILALAVAALPAAASPTVEGPTGLMFVPTADVLPNGGFNFALHRAWDSTFVTFNTSMMENLEFGVTSVSWERGSDARGNIKFRLMAETRQNPSVAVGVADLADDLDRSVYVVATKNLSGAGFRGTIGLSSKGLLAGLAKELNTVSVSNGARRGAPGAVFMAELDGSALNVGVGITLAPAVRANIYLYDLRTAVLGLSYEARF